MVCRARTTTNPNPNPNPQEEGFMPPLPSPRLRLANLLECLHGFCFVIIFGSQFGSILDSILISFGPFLVPRLAEVSVMTPIINGPLGSPNSHRGMRPPQKKSNSLDDHGESDPPHDLPTEARSGDSPRPQTTWCEGGETRGSVRDMVVCVPSIVFEHRAIHWCHP